MDKTKKYSILIVDDDTGIRSSLEMRFSRDFKVFSAENASCKQQRGNKNDNCRRTLV